MALISLVQLKKHLRMDPDDSFEDGDLHLKMLTAESLVLAYITRPDDEDQAADIAAWTFDTVPVTVQAAILLQAGELCRFRGDEDGPKRGHGALTPQTEAILYASGYRRPVVA